MTLHTCLALMLIGFGVGYGVATLQGWLALRRIEKLIDEKFGEPDSEKENK